jgi:hypothetical protein
VRKRWQAPTASAAAKVREAAIRDELSGRRLQQRLKDLGPQGTVADAGGKNIQGLARHTASVPGPAQNRATILLNQRAGGETARINRAVAKGLDPQDYHAAEEGFLNNLRTKAGPRYQKAYEQFQSVTSPRLKDILASKSGQRALREAVAITENERAAGIAVADVAGAAKSGNIPLQAWDDIKRGFDALLEKSAYRNKLTGKLNAKGWSVDKLRRALLKELDEATGGKTGPYAQARAIYAGEAEALNALRDGRKALNWDPERVTKYLGETSEAGKEAFRSGFARALKDVVSKTPDKASGASRIFGTVAKRSVIRAAFPDARSYRELSKALIAEQRFAQTRNQALAGSQTAPRLAESVDALQEAAGVAGVAGGTQFGKVLGAHTLMTAGLGRRVGKALMGKPSEHDLEVARLLFNRDQGANQRAIDTLFTRTVWDGLPPEVKRKIGQAMLIGATQQGTGVTKSGQDLAEDFLR